MSKKTGGAAQTLLSALQSYASLSIIGMGKNAGKTTVLNRLIALHRALPETLALTSIGRDGEATDVVTGTAKPGIWVDAGTLVATAADMLRLSDTTCEILATTGVHTPLGEVVVFRALSDGFVQLAGPSMNEQLAALVGWLRDLGAQRVLIDGAIHRKSLAAPAVSEAAILCAGASYHPDMETVVADTAYVCRLFMLPQAQGENAARIIMEGAATDAVLGRMTLKAGDEVTVEDSSRLLLSRAVFERLTARGVRFSVRRAGRLCCVCINPFAARGPGFARDAFHARMAAAVPVPVLDVKEEAFRDGDI